MSLAAVTAPRRAAYEVLRRCFEDGAWADRAFASAAARLQLDERDLAQGRRLAYGSVQRRGTADYVITALARRRLERIDAPALAALRLGLYELLFADAAADHAAVDQAVELTKHGLGRGGSAPGRARAGAGFVNALLRRAVSERERLLGSLRDDTPEGAAVAHSYPTWIAETWWRQLGEIETRALMAAMNEPAETAMRVNTLLADPVRVAAELRAAGIEVGGPGRGTLLDPQTAIVIDRSGEPVGARVAAGELVPQSRASQAVVELLDPRPGERVLDLCAGPGIKTTAIAARMGNEGEVRSVELDPRRAAEVERLCERVGATIVGVEAADAAEADLGSGYDRILLDPPCTDLGTLASRPDARWRKSAAMAERLATLQRRLLVRAARALAPGGVLVYSTCTISAIENEGVAGGLADLVPQVGADDLGAGEPRMALRADRRFLQLLPQRDRTTGFFLARFRRAAA